MGIGSRCRLSAIWPSARRAVLVSLLSVLPAAGALAQTPEVFFKGRQITFLVGAGAGGGYDAYFRSFARYLVRHIPGAPTIVNKNMPAASGLAAANTLYTSAGEMGPPSGRFLNNIPMDTLKGNPGARFDAQKLHWFVQHRQARQCLRHLVHQPGHHHPAGARARGDFGGRGGFTHLAIMPVALNALLGTKFKIGRATTPAPGMTLAACESETEGVCGLSWSTMKAARPHWIKDNKLNVIVQMGLRQAGAELPNVPSALDLVSDPVKKQVLELILMRQEIGRPVAAPPGVPADRLAVLRQAFDDTMRDPEFLAEAEKLQLEIEPLSARDIDTLLAHAFTTPKAIVAQAAELIEPSAQK